MVEYGDLVLSIGKIKNKRNGKTDRKNSRKDISKKQGTEEIKGIKMGIGRQRKKNVSITNYVLSKVSKVDWPLFSKSIEKSSKIIDNFYKKILINY